MPDNCKCYRHSTKHISKDNNNKDKIKILIESQRNKKCCNARSLPNFTLTTGPGTTSTSTTSSFISLFNNLGGGSFSSGPGLVQFQDINGLAGVLQSTIDMSLSTDNATVNVATSGFYLINYNATIQLDSPSVGNWFTGIRINGTDINGPACKAQIIVGQTNILQFNGSLIVNIINPSTVQLRVVVTDGTRSWQVASNVNGYGTVSMTIARIM